MTRPKPSLRHGLAALAAIAAIQSTGEAIAQAQSAPTPVKATIDTGILVGESTDGVNIFRGVPFAKPPVGALRWKAAQKPDSWPGERAAIAYEPPCPQPVNIDQKTTNGGGVAGVNSEDCLYLQVYAPANAWKAPVMVWLYGGAAYLGAGHLGSFQGDSNAKNGVVTVSINYRLGALANFNHPELTREAGPNEPLGNYALTDAVAALEWVKRNIESFGGDPDNVTLAGQSAGAAMVVNLLSVPSAKGLYHKAVVQSGAMLRSSPSLAEAEAKGVEVAKSVGLTDNATPDQLRAVSAQSYVAAPGGRSAMSTPTDGRFRPTSTIDALNAGTEIDVPVLVGTNSGEGGFDSARKLAKLAGDTGYGAWLYNFAYVPSYRTNEWKKGVIHSGELIFSFNSVDTSGWGKSASGSATAADKSVAERVNSCWVGFYKMDPKAKSFTCANGFSWPAYTDDGDQAAVFEATPKLVKSKTLPDGPAR